MSRYSAITTRHEMLERIAGVLLSLASAAEQASRRTLPVLCLVLGLLRFADSFARQAIPAIAGSYGIRTNGPGGLLYPERARPLLGSSRRAEALRLAAGFRALAAFLAHVAVQVRASRQRMTIAEQRRILSGSPRNARKSCPTTAHQVSIFGVVAYHDTS